MSDGIGGANLIAITGQATFSAPTAIVYDGSAFLYVLDSYWYNSAQGSWVIRQVSLAEGERRHLRLAGARVGPCGIFCFPISMPSFLPRSHFIASTGGYTRTIAGSYLATGPTTSPPDSIAGSAAYFNNPVGMDITADSSSLLIADTDFGCIRRVGLNGSYPVTRWLGVCSSNNATYRDGAASAASFRRPLSLSIARDNSNAFVIDGLDIRRVIINPDGERVY